MKDWEIQFDKNRDDWFQMDGNVDHYKEFISSLLQKQREEAIREHDAKWHPLDKQNNMVNMHLVEEFKKEIREKIEKLPVLNVKNSEMEIRGMDNAEHLISKEAIVELLEGVLE